MTGTGGQTISIHELLRHNAETAIDLQRTDGAFPPGRNYMYDEEETPVRTTSNWLHVLLVAHELTGDERYLAAATKAVNFLLGQEVRPHGCTFYCRKVENKDKCNGLVGQANAIRALTRAGDILGRSDAVETARDVFEVHPFDEELGLWKRVEITGENLSYDRTLNHQIIFAKAICGLAEIYSGYDKYITAFLDGLRTNLRTHDSGLIKHYVRPRPTTVLRSVLRTPSEWNLAWNELTFHYYSRSNEHREKEIGYHTVNLRPLGAIKQRYQSHPFWKTEKFTRVVQYVDTPEYRSSMYEVDAGTTIPGIMTAHALLNLTEADLKNVKHLVEHDLERLLDPDTHLLTSEMVAGPDQASSICALVDFPDAELVLDTTSCPNGRSS